MAITITLALEHIEKSTKSLTEIGLSVNRLQMKLYKWTCFLTSTCLWLDAYLMFILIAKGEFKTDDAGETIYQISYIPMLLAYLFASTLDLLVIWSFYKLDKKVSTRMQERVTSNLM